MNKNRVTILLPAINEAKVIGGVIKSIRREGFNNIVVVNDGSRDSTEEVAKKNHAEVYTHIINRGVGVALETGMKALAEKNTDIIVMMDSDGQHDPKDIEKVAEPIAENKADLVLGSRMMNPKGMPFIRRFGNFGLSLSTFLLSGRWVTDTQTGFRALRRETIKRLNLKSQGYEICSEMIVEAVKKRMRIVEVPIRVIYTKYSLSKGQSIAKGIKTLFNLIKTRILN